MVSAYLQNLKAELINIEALYDRLNDGQHIDQRNEALALLKTKETFYNEELAKEQGIITAPPPEKVIPNNTILGPDLVPKEITQIINPGQVNKIPLLPIAAGVGIIILAVALTKRRKR